MSLDFKDTSTVWYNKQKSNEQIKCITFSYKLCIYNQYWMYLASCTCSFHFLSITFFSNITNKRISYILCHSFLQCYIFDTSCIFLWQNWKKAEVFREASEKSEPSWTLALGRISRSSICDPFWSVSFDKCHYVGK